jgi:indolepyruvate decarboxylase
MIRPTSQITISRLMGRINDALGQDIIVISDIGDALFAASDLVIHQRTEFLSPAYYTSMGFAVPATLGASVARPGLRVLAIVGDGAFQMTGMELSTIVRHHFDPIVIVLDNKGYGTERFLHPGDFNDIQPWNYSKLPEVLGGGTGYEVRTEGEFDQALNKALADKSGMSLIQVHLAEDDVSNALARLAENLSQKV